MNMGADILRARSLLHKMLKNDMSVIAHSLDVYVLVYYLYTALPECLKIKLNPENLLCAAMLHDIGKSSIAGDILNKAGRLNIRERKIIMKHAENGKAILEKERFGYISDWVRYHHERMDGTGYYFLTQEQIPLESKIISIVDTYSALTSDRVYRKRRSAYEAIKILRKVAGTQLDRDLINIFCSVVEKNNHFH